MKKKMIKRADGSMSPRGMWDNIRAAKGSGKKTRPGVPDNIRQGFELLGLTELLHKNYFGTQKFSRNFARCSKTKFIQVTYAASSH